MGSIQGPRRYLPGYVDSFRRVSVQALFYQTNFYSEGLSNIAISTSSHFAAIGPGRYQAGRMRDELDAHREKTGDRPETKGNWKWD
jgi:hypothetical protein